MATLLPKQALYQAELRPDGGKSRVSGWIGQAARGTKQEFSPHLGKVLPTIVPTLAAALLLFLGLAAAPAGAMERRSSAWTPLGYVDLLRREPDLAYPGSEPWETDIALLRSVNDRINRLPYAPDEPGEDAWGIGSDCEDYALLKMAALLRLGVPRGAMRLAVVDLWGQSHAVLIVGNVYVLDSLTRDIYLTGAYPAAFVAVESAEGWLPATRRIDLEMLLP